MGALLMLISIMLMFVSFSLFTIFAFGEVKQLIETNRRELEDIKVILKKKYEKEEGAKDNSD